MAPLRRTLPIALATALLLPATAAAAPRGKVVFKSLRAKAGAKTLRPACPRGYAALGGAVQLLPDGVVLTRSSPGPRARRWTFRFVGAGSARVRASLSCGRRVRVRNRGRSVRVRAGRIKAVRVRCPGASAPSGYGQRQPEGSSARASAAPVPPNVDVYRVRASRRSVQFGLRNDSTADGTVALYVRCERGARVVRRVFSGSLRNGETTLLHRCRRGQLPLAAGFSFDPSTGATLTAAYPDRHRAGRWTFQSALFSGVSVETSLLCLRR